MSGVDLRRMRLECTETGPTAVALFTCFCTLVLASLISRYLFGYSFTEPDPPPRSDDWPIVRALKYFYASYDFQQDLQTLSRTGAMSFHVGSCKSQIT